MIGIIGGTGLSRLFTVEPEGRQAFSSVYGEPSGAVCTYKVCDQKIAFLARHGTPHHIAPHLINYRANLDVLKQAGVTDIIAVNAVGGIHASLGPAEIAVPDQIIDYTYGRAHTIYDEDNPALDHIDMTHPYSQHLRDALLASAKRCDIGVLEKACYAATQGPRLETAAEVSRLRRDGADMIGMTGMPEAALAKEMGIAYASIALSVNWAAGLSDQVITMDDINEALGRGMSKVVQIVQVAVDQLARD